LDETVLRFAAESTEENFYAQRNVLDMVA